MSMVTKALGTATSSSPKSRSRDAQPAPLAAPTTRRGVPPAIGVTPLRIFLAAGWLRAGIEKLIDPTWRNGSGLRAFLSTSHSSALPFFRPVMDHAVRPTAVLVAFVVMATELGCGIAIAVGRPLRAALSWGALLNVVFMLSGAVNPSIFYLLMEAVLLLAIADGFVGGRPSAPSRRSPALAAVCALLGVVLLPFVRTIAPAKVIADPAIVLAFFAFIVSFSIMVRLGAATASPATTWTAAARRWATARGSGRSLRARWGYLPGKVTGKVAEALTHVHGPRHRHGIARPQLVRGDSATTAG